MSVHFMRGMMLVKQSRFDLARDEFKKTLSEDPDNAQAHAFLAIVETQLENYSAANDESRMAIHLAPDQPFVFYANSIVLASQNRLQEAQTAVEAAIELDPEDADYFAQLGKVMYGRSRWKETLEATDTGLSLEPEHVECTNLRAMALVKLGRNMEAQDAIESALTRAPEDAWSHANMGWSLLEHRKPREAMEHFGEALRLQPDMEWARLGIVEAMKAKFFVYRLILNWFLWMVKLQQKAQFGILLGAWIGYQILNAVALNNPALAPWIYPILILYISFCVMTWMASPFFNLVLRLNRFGRLALSDDEKRTSTRVGLCVLGAILMVGLWLATGKNQFIPSALGFALIIPPLSAIDVCEKGWPRATLRLITIALGEMGLFVATTASAAQLASGWLVELLIGLAGLMFLPFLIAAIAAQFATNWLTSVKPRKDRWTESQVMRIGGIILAVITVIVLVLVLIVSVLFFKASQAS